MKITINTTPLIQVSFTWINGGLDGVIDIYYFSGSRYEFRAELGLIGMGSVLFHVSNEDGEDVGTVTVEGETETEKNLFNLGYTCLYTREKETDKYYLINNKQLDTVPGTFQYKRNFTDLPGE